MNHVKYSLRPWIGPFSMLILSCAALSAQDVPAGIAVLPGDGHEASTRSGEPLPQFRILETKVTQLEDRTLTVHRVADPGLPALTLPPPTASWAVLRPPLTPAQLAARPAAREIRILSLSVTRYADNLSYIEWWPHGGGPPLGAWSNADYGALRMVPDFEVSPGDITYLLFPFSITPSPLRPGQGPVAWPQLPADGPGFLVVKGEPADADNVNPIAALHKVFKEEGPELKRQAEARERERLQEEARLAAQPPVSKDVVIRYWESKPIHRTGGAR